MTNFEIVREARLRYPFKPFVLRTVDGREIPVTVPTHLAVSPKSLVVTDPVNETPLYYIPYEIDALIYPDEAEKQAGE